MLVLTRRQGEEIVIRASNGEEIVIKAIRFEHFARQDRVILGITAPREVSIFRREIKGVTIER